MNGTPITFQNIFRTTPLHPLESFRLRSPGFQTHGFTLLSWSVVTRMSFTQLYEKIRSINCRRRDRRVVVLTLIYFLTYFQGAWMCWMTSRYGHRFDSWPRVFATCWIVFIFNFGPLSKKRNKKALLMRRFVVNPADALTSKSWVFNLKLFYEQFHTVLVDAVMCPKVWRVLFFKSCAYGHGCREFLRYTLGRTGRKWPTQCTVCFDQSVVD